jgi:hypothetical protein
MLRRPSKRRPSSSTRAAGPAAPPARSKHEQAKQQAQRANKIFPRNLTAQAAYLVPGNPVITRPEDAVANCFPGLEIDIRNLDRRFFPGLVFDFIEEGARLAYVDAFQDPDLKLNTDDARQLYLQLADDDLQKRLSKGSWYLDEIEQNGLRISMNSLKDTTAWRIVRSLELGPVTIRLKQRKTEHVSRPHRRKHTVTLKGWRRRFMDPKTGVLSGAYQPGELMLGLCSPWQHDFRDCACFYWAANHPDIVLPEIYPGESASEAATDPSVASVPIDWMRADRATPLAAQALPTIGENRVFQIDHFQINRIWQDLNLVLEGRESGGLYVPQTIFTSNPFGSPEELAHELRNKLGPLEIALTFEYLYARFSLLGEEDAKDEMLRAAVTLARELLLLVAASEMQHLRWVNQMLWDLLHAGLIPGTNFEPVLTPATKIPASTAVNLDRDFDSVSVSPPATLNERSARRTKKVHQFISEVRQDNAASGPHRLDTYRSASLRPLTPEALKDFIAIEHPSSYIDGAYSRVIATLDQGRAQRYPEHMVDLAVRIASDGVQHETRFRQIKDALSPFFLNLSYLRKNFREGNKIEAKGAIKPLRTIKDNLRSAYIAAAGNQFGRTAEKVAEARGAMVQLLEVGEELAAKRRIGIPFFKIWNELP